MKTKIKSIVNYIMAESLTQQYMSPKQTPTPMTPILPEQEQTSMEVGTTADDKKPINFSTDLSLQDTETSTSN